MIFLFIWLGVTVTSVWAFRDHCPAITDRDPIAAWLWATGLAAAWPVLLIAHLRKVLLRAIIFPT